MNLECGLQDNFDGYCLDQLTSVEKDNFENHLSECSSCNSRVVEYQNTLSLVKKAKAPSFTEAFWNHQKNEICSSAAKHQLTGSWVAPRFSLIAMTVFVGAFIIDGLGFLYVSESYISSVFSLIAKTTASQVFDVSFLLYACLIGIGIMSFMYEPDSKRNYVSAGSQAPRVKK